MDYANAQFRKEEEAVESETDYGDGGDDPSLLYIWRWFCDLTDWREQGFGIGPLSHQEIESWARLYRLDICPSEVDALRKVDRAFRLYQNEKNNPSQSNQSIGDSLRDIAEANAAKKAAEEKQKTRAAEKQKLKVKR